MICLFDMNKLESYEVYFVRALEYITFEIIAYKMYI